MEFVEGFEDPLGLTVTSLTVLFRAITEQPMTVEIDDAGTTMTMTGLFSGLRTAPDLLAPLTACKDAPCAGGVGVSHYATTRSVRHRARR